MNDPTTHPAWAQLKSIAPLVPPLRDLITGDRDFLGLNAAGLYADFSRQRLDHNVFEALINLANESGVDHARDSMFAGDRINTTEDRSVLHTALRLPRNETLKIDGTDIGTEVHAVLDHMSQFADQIRSGMWKGVTGKQIRRVINIGIGGSDLGPAMAHRALIEFADPSISMEFVSNVDPEDIQRALANSDPQETLCIIASKTFTTAETMANAHVARAWLMEAFPDIDPAAIIPKHFVAISTNATAVAAFGIDPKNMFGFWDWVGGRYSMDSAIGLSTMIAIGPDNFMEMLSGFHAMDKHFQSAPIRENVPIIMALMAIWNRNFLGIETTAVLPYSQNLSRFPAYLQQLTMESNGKSTRKDGSHVSYQTGAIYWGEPGTNGQHSFYQLLHQGTSPVACDFIIVANNHGEPNPQQEVLVANGLAQAAVLSLGVTEIELLEQGTPQELVPHKTMPGNRPVTVLMISRLTPFSLGALIALYEHSVFVQGVIWGINSFDQWGVEMGKKVAKSIELAFHNSNEKESLDRSTQRSVDLYRNLIL